METKPEPPVLKYDKLVFSTRGIAEAEGRKVVLFVPLNEIGRVTLKYGRADHRPMITLSIGIVLLLVGIYGFIELVLAPRGMRYEMAMMFFGFVGGSLTFDSLKRRFFLEVQRGKTIRRLVFSKKARLNEIQDFCHKVSAAYRIEIANNV